MTRRLVLALTLLLALAQAGCEHRASATGIATSAAPAPTASSAPSAPRARKGGLDVTFFVTSDTHFGVRGIERWHQMVVDTMNGMPRHPLPSALGGKVAKPRGVLITGDLTDNDKPEQWRAFAKFYGLTGKDGELHYPVYEAVGNHDFWNARQEEKKRHGELWYSFDFDDLHLVCLGEAPTDETLDWLERDLRGIASDVPLVVYMHFPLLGPYSDTWFKREHHDERLGRVLDGHNVVAIFHGHFHGSGSYRWHGYDVYNVGSAKHSARSYAVAHVTDTSLEVASYNYELRDWWWWHEKPINGGKGKTAIGTRPGEPTPYVIR
jgi:3',5'-cyclic AMP phosphodiesterase CpdA